MGSFFTTFWTDFIDRFDGPLHFRLLVQPLMAILFAIRDGRRDAREGRGAYLWKFVHKPEHRRQLLESGVKSISKVFVLAFALDVVYQFVEWHGLKPAQALMTAIVLAVIPYVLLRGPVNRLTRSSRTRRSVV
jgi:Flp pilus assembly protein TadB